jgi:hypothetical protein
MTSVLIRFMHGLGDAVQFTAVLQHIRQHRPDWEVDVYSLRGKHSAFHGLCRRSYHEQEGERPSRPYGARYDLGWFENYNGYTDRPNSKITNCLQEVFHIPYDANLGRYQVQVSAAAMERAGEYLGSIGCQRSAVSDQPLLIGNSVSTNGKQESGRYNAIIFHYQGNTSQDKKNLTHEQVKALVDLCLEAGFVPVILDWDGRSPLFDNKRVFNPGVHPVDADLRLAPPKEGAKDSHPKKGDRSAPNQPHLPSKERVRKIRTQRGRWAVRRIPRRNRWGFEPFQKLQQELHFPPLRFVLLQRQVAFRTERQNLPPLRGLRSIRATRRHSPRHSAL